MIKKQLAQIFKTPVTYCCIAIYAGVLLLGIWEDINAGDPSIGWFEMFWLSENFGVACLISPLIFPIAIAIVCFEEKKGHYDWLMLMRAGHLRYCFSKIASAVLASIIMYTVSSVLTVVLGSLIFPAVYNSSSSERLSTYFPGGLWAMLGEKSSYWISFFIYIVFNSLNIGIFSLLAVCMSVFGTNRYVICALPFFLSRIGTYFGGVLSKTTYSLFAWETAADGGIPRCIIYNLAAYAVLGCLFYLELRWRETHG